MNNRAYPNGFELFKKYTSGKQVIKKYLSDNIFKYWHQPKAGVVNVLDIGCARGVATGYLIESLNVPKSRLKLSLIEPEKEEIDEAAEGLQAFNPECFNMTYAEYLTQTENKTKYHLIFNSHSIYYTGLGSLPTMFASLEQSGALLMVVSGKESFFKLIADVFPHAQETNGETVFESMKTLPANNLIYESRDISLAIEYCLDSKDRLTEDGKDLASFLLLKEYDECDPIEKEAIHTLFSYYHASGKLSSTNDFIWAIK